MAGLHVVLKSEVESEGPKEADSTSKDGSSRPTRGAKRKRDPASDLSADSTVEKMASQDQESQSQRSAKRARKKPAEKTEEKDQLNTIPEERIEVDTEERLPAPEAPDAKGGKVPLKLGKQIPVPKVENEKESKPIAEKGGEAIDRWKRKTAAPSIDISEIKVQQNLKQDVLKAEAPPFKPQPSTSSPSSGALTSTMSPLQTPAKAQVVAVIGLKTARPKTDLDELAPPAKKARLEPEVKPDPAASQPAKKKRKAADDEFKDIAGAEEDVIVGDGRAVVTVDSLVVRDGSSSGKKFKKQVLLLFLYFKEEEEESSLS